MRKNERYLDIDSSQVPLTEVPYDEIKMDLINPVTKKPYKGIILEGCFVDLNPTPNNNMRIYDIPEYLRLLRMLKKQIHTRKGVYGELEHPKGYAVDFKNASHKLLDVWYIEEEKKIYGRLVILNKGNGLIAREIIESGGQLAISARAAGEETEQQNGTKKAVTKLLVTFDLVYHPGFASAVLNFKELNESQKFTQNISANKNGFSGRIYENELNHINDKYAEYILNENNSLCFYEWLFTKNLNESKQLEKQQQEILEKKESSTQEKLQKKLQEKTKQDLSEKENFFNNVKQNQQKLKYARLGASYYDNSAGFVTNESEKNCK